MLFCTVCIAALVVYSVVGVTGMLRLIDLGSLIQSLASRNVTKCASGMILIVSLEAASVNLQLFTKLVILVLSVCITLSGCCLISLKISPL